MVAPKVPPISQEYLDQLRAAVGGIGGYDPINLEKAAGAPPGAPPTEEAHDIGDSLNQRAYAANIMGPKESAAHSEAANKESELNRRAREYAESHGGSPYFHNAIDFGWNSGVSDADARAIVQRQMASEGAAPTAPGRELPPGATVRGGPLPQAKEQGGGDDVVTGRGGAPPGEEQGSGARAAGGGVVPAHEVPIVDPLRQKALRATFPREAEAELNAAETEAQAHEAQAEVLNQQVKELEDQQQANLEDRAARHELVGQLLQDAYNTARDVATKKVDPERFWKTRSTGQQISYIIAAALGGFAHDHQAANFITHLIDQDVEAQRADIENGHRTTQDKMSVFNAALQATQNMDLAAQHDIATKLQYAMMRVKAQSEESQAPIVRARAQALLVALERKSIEVGIAMNKYVPQQLATAGAGAVGNILDVDHDQLYQVAPGQFLLVGKGERQKLVDAQGASNDIVREVDALKTILGPNGNSINDYQQYRQAWEHIAAIAALQPQTVGKGSGKSLGQQQILMNKLGFSNDPREEPSWTQFQEYKIKNSMAPIGAASVSAADALSRSVRENQMEAINRASQGWVGKIVPLPPDRHGVSKLGFMPTGKFEPNEGVQRRAPPKTYEAPAPQQRK